MYVLSFLLFIYLCTIHSFVSHADIDCSTYSTDLDVIKFNPFYVRLNSDPSLTSVGSLSNGTVTYFRIVNDVNPSSNIYCLNSLQTLQLVNTNLTILPEIKNFPKLTSLIIQRDNGIIPQHLPAEFGQLQALLSLELTNITNLEDLPSEIEHLTSLTSLTLQSIPNLKSIPIESLAKLVLLQQLILIDLPNLSDLSTVVNLFQQLLRFQLSKTNVPDLKLQNLTSLSSLNVAANLILSSIQLSNMNRLTSIDIRNNNELLTVELQNLPSLQSFSLFTNGKLTSLAMKNLSGLSTLAISDSAQLQTITLKNLTGLRSIQLNTLPNLEAISFENVNSLSSVSIILSTRLKDIVFLNAPSVTDLDLSGCQLTIFPETIRSLKSLQKLTLTSNQLSALPPTLSTDLPNLQVLRLQTNLFRGNLFQPALIYIRELDLTNNSLTSLDGIGQYKSLQQMTLNQNKITSIPLEIMNISNTLATVFINNNELTTIPYQMTNLKVLTILHAGDNRITSSERQYLTRLFLPTKKSFFV